MMRWIMTLCLGIVFVSGCVSANDAKLADVRDNKVTGVQASADGNKGIDATGATILNKLEKLVEQNQEVTNKVGEVKQMNQEVKSQLTDKLDMMHTEIKAGTIHYGGAGWVVIGAALLVLIFLAAGIVTVWILLRNLSRTKGLLQLVTSAVQAAPPEAQVAIKQQVEAKTGNGSAALKKALTMFLVQHGLFAEAKPGAETQSAQP